MISIYGNIASGKNAGNRRWFELYSWETRKGTKDFKQIATELAKAHSLCAATNEGKNSAIEVSYFKAIKASLVKLDVKKPQKN